VSRAGRVGQGVPAERRVGLDPDVPPGSVLGDAAAGMERVGEEKPRCLIGQQSSRSGRASASSDIRTSGETLKRTASFLSSRTGGLAAFRQRLAAPPAPLSAASGPRRLTTTPTHAKYHPR
jgi:hypothetical protein